MSGVKHGSTVNGSGWEGLGSKVAQYSTSAVRDESKTGIWRLTGVSSEVDDVDAMDGAAMRYI